MPIVSLTHWTQQFSTPGEQAFLGITMMLVGILLVLAILIIISFAVSLMSRLSNRSGKIAEKNVAEVTKTVKIKSAVKETAVTTSEDNGALIAVIAAAVQMMLNQEGSTDSSAGFRIKKIRRV